MKRLLIMVLLSINLYATTINIGYGTASMDQYNKKDTSIAMDLWIKEIIKDTDLVANFTFYDDPKVMKKALKNNTVDMIIDYGIEFVMHMDISKLDDGFSGGMKNREDEHLVLVLPKDKDLDSFYALKKPLVAIQKRETLSQVYIDALFLEHGTSNKIELLKTKKRSGALLKLFFKKADAAIVTKKTFDFAVEFNPQLAKKLKIVKYSKLPTGIFGFFRKGFSEKEQKRIMKLALNVSSTTRGAQLLTLFQTDTVRANKIEDLAPLRELYTKYLHLKEKN